VEGLPSTGPTPSSLIVLVTLLLLQNVSRAMSRKLWRADLHICALQESQEKMFK
jgi:hypothetical protein